MKGNFKLIIIIVFIVAAVLGIMVFAGVIKLGSGNQTNVLTGNIVLWGTVNKSDISPYIDSFNNTNKTFTVKYVQKSADTFDQDLLEALAGGTAPDLFFLPDNLAYSYRDKIFTIPYTNYPLASFKSNYASAAEVFLTQKGILAFPITIDPLMMYYNRTILDANNIVYPPKYWDEFGDMTKKITQKDDTTKQIIKSAVALGQYSNVTNAKDILSTLFMQMGSPIITQIKSGTFSADLSGVGETKFPDLGATLEFYTNFADPLSDYYSWNKSLPPSQDFFATDSLAFYFGYASELPVLLNKNPNENFLVSSVPQIKGVNGKATMGRVTGIAISSASKNFKTAYGAANLLASSDFAMEYAKMLGVAPARRDLLATLPGDDFFPVFYSSALYAKSWLDPSPVDSDNVFRLMVDSVLSNAKKPKESVYEAGGRLNLLLN